jgi:outer membrane protein
LKYRCALNRQPPGRAEARSPRAGAHPLRALAACAFALCAAPPAGATTDFLADTTDTDSAGWGFAARFEHSPYRGGGVRADLMPLYLYEGEYIYLHSYRAGLKFRPGPDRRVNVFLSHRFESFPVDRVPASLAAMPVRVPGTDFGLSYEERFDWGKVFGEYLRDASHVSGGAEWRLGYSAELRRGGLKLAPYVMLSARDARLNNYYYGVVASEIAADRPAYQPGAGVNGTVGLNARYALTDTWHFFAGLSATLWSGGVRRSPIVEDRPQLAAFGGLAYEFVPTPDKDGRDRIPLTFKVLHGKSTPCNLLPLMELRCRSVRTDDDTRIDSFEVGWPFIENPRGWPVTIAWYGGLLRHEERGLQPDFWQANLYLKAFYWGFPWKERVRTRIGFGGGLSYAHRVPFVEARDQAMRGRNTSKLLQYADPTIDVSVGDLFGARELRETYFGFGASHRSGVFGMAQLFDNVNGGSNYIYTYVEWKM